MTQTPAQTPFDGNGRDPMSAVSYLPTATAPTQGRPATGHQNRQPT